MPYPSWSELERYGHVFRTNSDTEVIIRGYKQWGDEVLNHLNGMFGLAIWDVRKRRLVLARDPFGIKLLYYLMDGNRLYFGSEMRAVCAALRERPEIDASSFESLPALPLYTLAVHNTQRCIEARSPGPN